MTEKPVLYVVRNAVATITLNRPEVHNAFDEEVIADLTRMVAQAGADPAVRAVVLRGSGKSFCAGGDLAWMRKSADYDRARNVEDAMRLGVLLKNLNALPKVTVALVHGNVFGGGVGLTACCDVAIAAEGAVFCLSEVRIGLIPSIIAPYVINAMGQRQARRYFLTAERFGAEKAREIGFVHETCPAGHLDSALESVLAAVMDGAPGAQGRGKRLMQDIAGKQPDDDVIRRTVEQIAEARASDEGKEGLSAFLNKTEPGWRRRGA